MGMLRSITRNERWKRSLPGWINMFSARHEAVGTEYFPSLTHPFKIGLYTSQNWFIVTAQTSQTITGMDSSMLTPFYARLTGHFFNRPSNSLANPRLWTLDS